MEPFIKESRGKRALSRKAPFSSQLFSRENGASDSGKLRSTDSISNQRISMMMMHSNIQLHFSYSPREESSVASQSLLAGPDGDADKGLQKSDWHSEPIKIKISHKKEGLFEILDTKCI